MLIGKFNKFFARHGRVAFLIILLLIGIPFIFFFGVDIQPFTQSMGTGDRVGYVNDTAVSEQEFRRHLAALELRSRGGNMLQDDFWIDSAPQVFTRVHMLESAREQGLGAVSDQEVAAEIRRIPFFQNEQGQFNPTNFQNFKRNYLSSRGLAASDFDQMVRDDIIISRLLDPYVQGFTVSDLELRYDAAAMNLEYKGEIARWFVHDQANVAVTAEEIEQYYEAEKGGALRVPNRQKLFVAYTNASEFISTRPSVTDTELEAYYEANKDEYAVEEVRASHILFRVPSDASDEQVQEIRQRAEAVLTEAKQADSNFAELAEQHSEDRWSAEKGGDVGWFEMGQRPFAEEVFAMENGQLYDDLIRSNFGFHIVKKLDQRDGFKEFNEVSGLIRMELLEQKNEAQYGEQARAYYDENQDEFNVREVNARHILIQASREDSPTELAEKREKLQDILAQARGGADFAELAKEHSEGPSGADGGALGWITKNGRMVPTFENAARATPTGGVSDIIRTQFGFHIIKVDEERMNQKAYEDVRGEIIQKLRSEESASGKNRASQLMTTFMTRLFQDSPYARTVEPEARIEAFMAYAREYAEQHEHFHVKLTDPYAADAATVPGIPGPSGPLLEAAQSLNDEQRVLSRQVTSGDYHYMAGLAEQLSGYEPELDEDLRSSIRSQLREEKAKDIIRKKASKAAETLRQAMADGKTFAEAKEQLEITDRDATGFVPVGPFNLMQGPDVDRDYDQAIVAAARETSPGEISEPQDYEYGVVLLYVESVDLDKGGLDMTMSYMGDMYRNMMAQAMQSQLEQKYASQASFSTTRGWDWLHGSQTDAEGGQPPVMPVQ